MKPDHQPQKGTSEKGKKTKKTALDRNGSHLIEFYAHAPIGLVECSLDGKYVNVNEEFCRITGHTKEELLRLDIYDLILPADIERERGLYKELTSGSLPFYNIEERYVRQNGAMIWVGIIRSLVRDRGGELRPHHRLDKRSELTLLKAESSIKS